MSKIFAVNLTPGNLVLKTVYLIIQRGGFAEVTEQDKQDPTFMDALSKKWISYSSEEPVSTPLPPVPAIEFVNPNVGMTAEELIASQQNQEPKAPAAVTEAIGQGGIVTGEASTSKLGDETERTSKKTKRTEKTESEKAE
jgi:hypothetical protein